MRRTVPAVVAAIALAVSAAAVATAANLPADVPSHIATPTATPDSPAAARPDLRDVRPPATSARARTATPSRGPGTASPTDRDAPETRTQRVKVAGAGTVIVTHTHQAIIDVQVQTNDGWKYGVTQRNRTHLRVGFGDGTTRVLLTAVLRDGVLRTAVTTPVPSNQPDADRTRTPFRVFGVAVVTVGHTDDAIVKIHVRAREGWDHRMHRDSRDVAILHLTDGATALTCRMGVADGALRHACARDTTRPDAESLDDSRPRPSRG